MRRYLLNCEHHKLHKCPIIQQLKGTIMSLIIAGRKKRKRDRWKNRKATAPSGAALNDIKNPENILNDAEAQGLRCTHMHKQTHSPKIMTQIKWPTFFSM